MPTPRQAALLSGGLRPSLSLDFTTGLLDSRVTASGGANGTRVNSAGNVVTASAPRFGYDPVTLAPLGLLVEEARTNLVTWSQDFSNAAWFVGAVAKTSTNNADPGGTTSAALLTASGASTTHYIISGTIAATSGTSYAFSFYVKPGTATRIQLTTSAAAFPTTAYVDFDLTGAGSVTATGAGATLGMITAVGGGWFRIVMMAPATSSTNDTTALSFITGATDTRVPTNSSAATLYVWGAQVEAVASGFPGPTSYIPTTSASVTRSADSASMTGASFSSWFNQPAGTFIVRATPPGNYDQSGYLLEADSASNSFHGIEKTNGSAAAAGKRFAALTDVASSVVAQIVQGSDQAAATAKLAYAYATNDFAFVADGALVGSDSSGALPSPTQLGIGGFNAVGLKWNGHISRIDYYNQRLSNGVMQGLTQ